MRFAKKASPTRNDVFLLERRYRGQTPLSTFFVLYKGDWHNLALACVLFILKHSGVWAMPVVTALIIDELTTPTDNSSHAIIFYIGLLVLIVIQNIPTHYLFVMRMSIATRNMEAKLRAAMTRRLQYLSMLFYHRNSTGVLQTKLLRDVEVLQELTMQLSHVLPSAIFTLVFAVGVTMIRVPEFIIFFGMTVPLAALITKLAQNHLKKSNRAYRQSVEAMSSGINDMIQLLPITRAHGIEQSEMERMDVRLDGVRQTGIKLDLVNALYGAAAWVSFRLFEILCLASASYAVITQIFPITVGDVIMLTGFFTNLTNAVLQIANILPLITKGFESIYSIGEVLESPDIEENEGKQKVKSVSGKFNFESVSFVYPDTDDSSVQQLSFDVTPGETVAIVGASGAGKSTVLNLIIGFIRPTSGRILLDGVDMNLLDLRTYRRFLSVVSQDTVLFDGTLRDNVLYGMPPVSDEVLYRALKAANALEFVEQLPDDVNTMLGEDAIRLSGGQRQRIAIARALVRNPQVLILDEATSALDTVSESKVQEALNHLLKGRTTFIVAHRLSTIQNADKIIVLNQGRLVEMGTHLELLERNGDYAAMVSAMALHRLN